MVCSLISFCFDSPQIAYNRNLLKLLYWSRDMLSFDMLHKGRGIVFPAHFMYNFSIKIFLMLYSINWPNFIVWLPLLLEILRNMCIQVVTSWILKLTYLSKSTFSTINNIIFIAIICFVNSKTLFVILLHSKCLSTRLEVIQCPQYKENRRKKRRIEKHYQIWIDFKGALSGLRQFLTTESPLKMVKNAFAFHRKSSFPFQDI